MTPDVTWQSRPTDLPGREKVALVVNLKQFFLLLSLWENSIKNEEKTFQLGRNHMGRANLLVAAIGICEAKLDGFWVRFSGTTWKEGKLFSLLPRVGARKKSKFRLSGFAELLAERQDEARRNWK